MAANQYVKQSLKLLAVAFTVTLVFLPALIPASVAKADVSSEYHQFVHAHVSSVQSNWTSVDEPMYPVYFNDSQIPIGSNWTVVEPLVAGHSYHIYLYGSWVNNGSTPKTDYNIYVYDPKGVVESEHTEAAGLLPHLGNTVNDAFFVPSFTGNYTFVISNSAETSNGAQQATFMAIEDVAPNQWQTQHIDGNSSWACEFVSDSSKIQVWINVPNTLDVYEARLYLMSNPQSLVLNDVPLPWEPGLYGNLSGAVGGYSADAFNYRGVAYASCEYKGENMLLEYSPTSTGKILYHLVLIGQFGSGNVSFLVKTQFDNPTLVPLMSLDRVIAGNETKISYSSSSTNLENALMNYSSDNWNSTSEVQMGIVNATASFTIPPQTAGTLVQYRVFANDTLLNSLYAEGNFTAKQPSTLNITVLKDELRVGENVTVNGMLTGQDSGVPVTLQLLTPNDTYTIEAQTSENGTFTASFRTNSSGIWEADATFAGDNATYSSDSNTIMLKVDEQPFYVKNGPLIGGGFLGAIAVVGVVSYVRKRRQ